MTESLRLVVLHLGEWPCMLEFDKGGHWNAKRNCYVILVAGLFYVSACRGSSALRWQQESLDDVRTIGRQATINKEDHARQRRLNMEYRWCEIMKAL